MKKLLAVVALMVSACGVDDPRTEAFREGFPRSQTVKLDIPGASTSQPLTGVAQRRDGLEGQTAKFYQLTRDVTVTVNGGVVAALNLAERIIRYPATTVTTDTAVWGPHTDQLSPNTWKFTVTRRAPNDYAYQLEGKGKSEADTAFRVVLSGQHQTLGRSVGSGALFLNWEAASTLPEHEDQVGSASYTYSRPSLSGPTQVDAVFTQVRHGGSGQLVDATYHFTQTPQVGGALEFQLDQDLFGGPTLELLVMHSRWQASGAGRADARVSGGDVTAAATANECWDSNFASRWFATSFDPAQAWGSPSVCAFTVAEYARP